MYKNNTIPEIKDYNKQEFVIATKDYHDSSYSLEKPLISIIIPVLQEEKILAKNLKFYSKALRKKYNFEVIVSDGGSSDKSIEIAETYADLLIETNCQKQNISQGRNSGAIKSKGEILVFINADTLPKSPEYFFSFIHNWYEGKTNYSSADALACKVTVFQDEILFKDRIFYMLHNFYVHLLNSFGIGMGRGECQIVKKEMFLRTGGYNEKIIAGEDFDFYHRISKIGKVVFVKELVVCESPRRFRKYGYIKIIFKWTINALSVLLKGKSISEDWEPVR